jgi:hypothetical protein
MGRTKNLARGLRRRGHYAAMRLSLALGKGLTNVGIALLDRSEYHADRYAKTVWVWLRPESDEHAAERTPMARIRPYERAPQLHPSEPQSPSFSIVLNRSRYRLN